MNHDHHSFSFSFWFEYPSVQRPLVDSVCHVMYVFLISTLIGFLQVLYQNKSVSPFETHPTTIKAFFFTFCVYCSTLVAKSAATHLTIFTLHLLSHFNLISGVISSLSLLTIFLPSWLNKLLISILGIIIPLFLGRHVIKSIYRKLCEKTINAVIYVVNVFRSLMRHDLMEQLHLLV